MVPLLVVVSRCFMENIVVTCKFESFLCWLDNLLQKNVIVFFFFFFFFGKSNFKMALIWKRGYFWPTFHIFDSQRKSCTNSFSTYLTHIQTRILLTLLTFFTLPISKNKYLEQSINNKWWAKFELECLPLICVYTDAKFIVICKPRTLNDGGEDFSSVQKLQKALLLSSSYFAFLGKIIMTWLILPESFGSSLS